MNTKTLAYAVIALVIVGSLAVILSSNHNNTQINNTVQSPTTSGTATSNSSATLFSSTSYYPYAYLISSASLSQQAQAALAGFNMTNTQLTNGTKKITITLQGTSQNQVLMLKSGYKLYIIETTFGDDGYGFDSSLGDDGFVVVNQAGYVA